MYALFYWLFQSTFELFFMTNSTGLLIAGNIRIDQPVYPIKYINVRLNNGSELIAGMLILKSTRTKHCLQISA